MSLTRGAPVPQSVWLLRLAVALLPALVLLRQDNSLFAQPHNIDSWMYLGYFRNLAEFKMAYRATYYGSRLSWILPGWVVHSLFSPLIASFVLHLTVHLTATLSLFEILRRTVAIRAAFLATLVFSMNPQLWAATGWDYTDGAGIAYCLLGMALLTGTEVRRPGAVVLMLGGAAIAAMLYSNLFWIVMTPSIAIYCLALQVAWRRGALWRNLLRTGLWATLGASLLTAVLCLVNHRLDGLWWFYEPSIRAARELSAMPNPWFRGIIGTWGLEPWLWFTAIATVLAVLEVGRPSRWSSPLRVGFALMFLASLGGMAFFQYVRRQPVLGLSFYADYLLPFTFLVIGSALWEAAESMRPGRLAAACAAAALGFAFVWADWPGRLTPIWPERIVEVTVVGGLLLAAAYVLRTRQASVVLALAGFVLFSSEVRFASGMWPKGADANPVPVSAHEYRDVFERVMRQSARIDSVRGKHSVLFWYDENEPDRSEYWALNSYYLFIYSRINGRFPEGPCARPLDPGTVVVIPTRSAALIGPARERLAGCWPGKGLRVVQAAPDSAWQYITPYTLSISRVEAVDMVR